MDIKIGGKAYIPGMYSPKGRNASKIAEDYIKAWTSSSWESPAMPSTAATIPPCICLAREIGAGALEIADRLAEKIGGWQVIDREILEHIAHNADLSEKAVAVFDERYPGLITELLKMTFGEKSFIKSDYLRHLFGVVVSVANSGKCVFVGRGVHLILPRQRVLAVKIVAPKSYRALRLAEIMGASEQEALSKIESLDDQQRDFFSKVFSVSTDVPFEYDLIINRQHFPETDWAAGVICSAFEQKFSE